MDVANSADSRSSSRWADLWAPLAVLLVGSTLAANLLVRFWGQADHLWYSLQHDRNAHYLQGLTIGMSLRHGDVASLFRELERMQVWGLLHPVLEGLVQLAAGPSHRLAVLPSLVGWVGCAVLGFLLTRRMVSRGGNIAGFLTALFIFASPGHRAFATDIMLESLGACLSLAVLYSYLVFVQEGTRRSAIWLAILWTLLFFHKYNYWLMVSIPLVLAEAYRHRLAVLAFCRSAGPHLPLWLRGQLARPLTWLIAVPAALGIYIWKVGPLTVTLGQSSLTIRTFHGLVHIAFVFFCVRLVLWWRAGGREWLATWPANQRTVLLGHALPVLVWFLVPKRLGTFLWFISPANNDQKVEHYVPFYGFSFYRQAFMDDYLVQPWLLWLIVASIVVLLLRSRKLNPGSIAVMLFLAVATGLTVHHPMLKNRYMHSWVAIYWVAAGAGFALGLDALARLTKRGAQAAGVVGLSALALCLHAAFLDAGHAQEGGIRPERPTLLEITELYQPLVEPDRRFHILCSDVEAFGFKWAYLEQSGQPRLVGLDIPGFNRANQDPQVVQRWLRDTNADALVLIDITPESPYWDGLPLISLQPLQDALREQAAFQCAREWDLAGGTRVMLWTRTSLAQSSR